MAESWEQVDPAELAALTDDETRQRYFAERPDLLRADLAWHLADESGGLLRLDLERAATLAGTASWLADRLDDPGTHGRALRATGSVLYFQRRYEDAAGSYERAVEACSQAGAELEAAIAHSSALGPLGNLGRYQQAMRSAAAARTTFEKLGDRLRLSRLENNVGMLLSRQDRFPEAIEHYRRAHELFVEVGQPADVASTLRNIAVCYQDLNDFHASREAYSQAREYCREHGQTLIGLEVEYNIAYIYYLRGEYSQAIRLFEEARRHSREQGDPHHAALSDLDLAEIFLELNLVHDAEHLAKRSFAAFDELGMRYETGKALAYQALAVARRHQLDTALDLLRRAREIFDEQENRVWTAMVDLYVARVLLAGERLNEAVGHAEAAYAGFRDSGVPSRMVLCLILRSRLAVGLDDLEAAKRHCDAALALAGETGRPLLEYQAHLAAGQLAEAGGDPSAALDSYHLAHQALERLRGQLQTDELKIAFTDDKQAVYEGLVAVTLAGGQSPEEIETAFGYVETAKSRGLADLLALGSPGVGAPAAKDNPLVGELGELRQELNWYYRQIGMEELRGGEASKRRLSRLREQTVQRERHLLRTLRSLQAIDAEFSSLQGTVSVDLASLRRSLPPDSALIEYFTARGLLYRFQLDRHSLQVRKIGSVARVAELHRQLRFQFGKFRVGGDYVKRFEKTFHDQAIALLTKLHDVLIGDLRPDDGIRHLIVVPHDFLHQMPFHALYDGERFLIDRLSISYAPSATVFQLCSMRRVESEERSLVLGVPDEQAPKILDEAQAVARILPNSTLLVGKEATRESLSRLAGGCRFVHIATHGLYRKDNPMFSALQLGDTRLSLLDLYDLDMEVEMAVLSGCGTGLSDVQGSDELVGLTRGLLFAGARSVVATLWDVNDDSTAELMSLFYRRLTEGSRPASALRHAMVTLRELHPHPYYWAPFVLTGTP